VPYKKLIIPLLIGLFNALLLIFPREVLGAAREGLLLWFHTILPSLLPFVIGTNLLIKLGFMRFIGGIIAPLTKNVFGISGAGGTAFITGIVSGYPIGAKTVGDLCREGDIKPDEARRLLAFCNNAGPLFIVGAVGIGMFGDAKAGYLLWVGHILGALAVGLLGRSGEKNKKNNFGGIQRNYLQRLNGEPFGKALGESVKNAMEAMILVGGLIILFNVVACIFRLMIGLEEGIAAGIFGGLLEISGGTKAIAAEGINTLSLAAAAFVIAFGGFSVHAQAMHFTAGTGIKAGVYLSCKILHGVLAAVFTVILFTLL